MINWLKKKRIAKDAEQRVLIDSILRSRVAIHVYAVPSSVRSGNIIQMANELVASYVSEIVKGRSWTERQMTLPPFYMPTVTRYESAECVAIRRVEEIMRDGLWFETDDVSEYYPPSQIARIKVKILADEPAFTEADCF